MTQPRDRRVVTETVRDEPVTAVVADDTPSRPLTWGPVWAGVLTAFGLFVLFSLLAIAGGLALVEFGQPSPGGPDVPVDAVASILTGLMLVVAFFAGGFIATWSAWEADNARGILYGFLVWALALVLLLVFAGLGLGQWFGAAGEIFRFTPGTLPDVDPQDLSRAAETAAWQTVFAIVLAMAAAVLGGLVGARDEFHRPFPYWTTR